MWGETVVNETVQSPRGARIAYDIAVRYRQGGARATVLLRNLTPDGARLENAGELRIGEVAMIQLPTLWHLAKRCRLCSSSKPSWTRRTGHRHELGKNTRLA